MSEPFSTLTTEQLQAIALLVNNRLEQRRRSGEDGPTPAQPSTGPTNFRADIGANVPRPHQALPVPSFRPVAGPSRWAPPRGQGQKIGANHTYNSTCVTGGGGAEGRGAEAIAKSSMMRRCGGKIRKSSTDGSENRNQLAVSQPAVGLEDLLQEVLSLIIYFVRDQGASTPKSAPSFLAVSQRLRAHALQSSKVLKLHVKSNGANLPAIKSLLQHAHAFPLGASGFKVCLAMVGIDGCHDNTRLKITTKPAAGFLMPEILQTVQRWEAVTELHFKDWTHLQLTTLSTAFPNLANLKISGGSLSILSSLEGLHSCSNLTSVNLCGTDIQDPSWLYSVLSTLPKLQHLRLGMFGLNIELPDPFARGLLQNLRSLECGPGMKARARVMMRFAASSLPNLRHLEVHYRDGMAPTKEVLEDLFIECPHLESLFLHDATLDSCELEAVLIHATNLTHLKMRGFRMGGVTTDYQPTINLQEHKQQHIQQQQFLSKLELSKLKLIGVEHLDTTTVARLPAYCFKFLPTLQLTVPRPDYLPEFLPDLGKAISRLKDHWAVPAAGQGRRLSFILGNVWRDVSNDCLRSVFSSLSPLAPHLSHLRLETHPSAQRNLGPEILALGQALGPSLTSLQIHSFSFTKEVWPLLPNAFPKLQHLALPSSPYCSAEEEDWRSFCGAATHPLEVFVREDLYEVLKGWSQPPGHPSHCPLVKLRSCNEGFDLFSL